jgi:hypothetical protein
MFWKSIDGGYGTWDDFEILFDAFEGERVVHEGEGWRVVEIWWPEGKRNFRAFLGMFEEMEEEEYREWEKSRPARKPRGRKSGANG